MTGATDGIGVVGKECDHDHGSDPPRPDPAGEVPGSSWRSAVTPPEPRARNRPDPRLDLAARLTDIDTSGSGVQQRRSRLALDAQREPRAMAQPSRSTAIGQAAPHGAAPPRAHGSSQRHLGRIHESREYSPNAQPLSAPTAHHEISVQRATWPSDGEGAPTAGPSAIGVVRRRHPEDAERADLVSHTGTWGARPMFEMPRVRGHLETLLPRPYPSFGAATRST
jgi:hypothetical protein